MTPSAPPLSTPTIFVIFGITGDLAARKILPAFVRLYAKNLLPEQFAIIGFARSIANDEKLREHLRVNMNLAAGEIADETLARFLSHISCEQGGYDDPAAYKALAAKIEGLEKLFAERANLVFQLSVPPAAYQDVIIGLGKAKLATRVSRILVEKPFGTDTKSAKVLNKVLRKYFKEEQIFRVDHYLAKAALKNLMDFRFANNLLAPLWNSAYIEKIDIQLLEKNDAEGRAGFYDGVGALRDVVQNHMLEMLAVLTMEKPASESAKDIRASRARALERLLPIKPRHFAKQIVKGQYEGYRHEQGVVEGSETETYVRMQIFIKSKQFVDVPFRLETGKAMAEHRTAIDVYFNTAATETLRNLGERENKVTFDMKRPSTNPEMLADYERLIHDCLLGDQTLFASIDEVIASWKFITPILEKWNNLPLLPYPKGASGVRE